MIEECVCWNVSDRKASITRCNGVAPQIHVYAKDGGPEVV